MRKGWEIKPLKDIAAFSQGIQVGLEKHETKQKEGYIRFIRIIDYTQNTEDIRYIPNPGEKYYVNEDDIVMVRYGSPGLVGRGKAGVIANNLFKITILRDDITNDYLTHFLSQDNIQKYLSSQGASTMPALNFGQLGKIEISFPKDINQQDQIVSILDDAFESIERAKSNAEQNLKNAKELFDSYLQDIFENKGEDWLSTTLGEVCSLYQGIAINAKTKHALVPISDLPLLRIKDLKNNTVEQYIDPNNFPINALVKEEDIIYTRTGSLGLVFRGKRGVLHNNSFKVVPNKTLNKDFLFIWLQNPIFKNKIMSLAMKAAQPDITHSIFKIQEINIPPIKAQKEIVEKLDLLSTETKKLESIYQQKLNDLEELKKSILQKAFNGELKTSKISA